MGNAVHPGYKMRGFPGGSVVKNPSANAGDTRGGFNPWRRKWQPPPLYLPGEPADFCLWSLKEPDMTECNGTMAGYKIKLVKHST